MKPRYFYAAMAVWCGAFLISLPSASAQEAPVARHRGVPQDWSSSHIVFSRNMLIQHPELMLREPRVRNQAMPRWQTPSSYVVHNAPRGDRSSVISTGKSKLHRDWNVPNMGGRMDPHNFAAKFSFDPEAPPDCTNDYVVYGLSVAGATGGQANLVAFNNLYVNASGTGFCAGTTPNVLFAYNVTTVAGGKIVTFPILSLDGTKIGFVESVPGTQAIFHVVTWHAGDGAIGNAAVPPVMTSVNYSPSADSTTSSPWLDYERDIVYVGADDSNVYEITGALTSSPTLAGFPWPIQVSPSYRITAPVLDTVLDLLMIGSGDGNLYQIDPTTGILSEPLPVGVTGGTTSGIVAPPVVDVTNGTSFVVSANAGVGVGAVLVEADTATDTLLATGSIGLGSSGGTALNLYEPAFDNNYANSSPPTGLIRVCGTGASDTTPYEYAFPFTANRTMSATATISQQLLISTSARCTGWTEFFNPFSGPTDTITATAVASDVLTVTANNSDLTVGETVYIQGTAESFLNGRAVIVASLIGPGPTYTGFTANFTSGDYSNGSDTGTVSAGKDYFFFGLTQDCTAAGTAGGCVEALDGGSNTFATPFTLSGGPSGIIVDNYSTEPEASSIYLMSRGQDTAYKLTQQGLN